jgi:predicted permease
MMTQELRDSVRMLTRHPRSSLLIVGLLAVGIGACAAVFTLFDAVFLRSLPVAQPDRLVILVQHYPKPLGTRSELPVAYYRSLRDHAKSLAAFGETDWPAEFAMTQPAPAAEIPLRAVTANYFEELGVSALYGRALLPSDARRRSEMPPAVLSYDLWRRRFNGDTRVVGRESILINKRYFAIVGVMPPGFKGTSADRATDAWIPLRAFPSIAGVTMQQIDLQVDGRLRPGFTVLESQAECRTIFQPVMKAYYLNVEKLPARAARTELQRHVMLQSLARGTSILRQSFGGALKLLMLSVGLLLLIVCSNVGGLLLAQAAARQQEFAVRQALGATRAQLVRQALAQALLLSVLGAAGGLLIARAATPIMVRLIPPMRILSTTLSLAPLSIDAGINGKVLWFVLGVVGLTMLLFSLAPTLAVSRSRLESLLRAPTPAAACGDGKHWSLFKSRSARLF